MVTGASYHTSYIRRQFHDVLMIFLPVYLFNSFLFLIFAIKYWPMVVNDPSTTWSLSVGWRCYFVEIKKKRYAHEISQVNFSCITEDGYAR